jgi:hypothetical protein
MKAITIAAMMIALLSPATAYSQDTGNQGNKGTHHRCETGQEYARDPMPDVI